MSSKNVAVVKHICSLCEGEFASRNKLFKHIAAAHHSCDSDVTPKKQRKLKGEDFPNIDTVLEDDWFRIVVKPQGMPTQGSFADTVSLMNHDSLLLNDAIKSNLSYKKAVPCHRLDRPTGGLVLCSTSHQSEVLLRGFFRHRRVKKRYRAITSGKIEPLENILDTPLKGQTAITRYRVVQHSPSATHGWTTTVDLWPVTGRKHQLRKHLQLLGHPIIGDERYSPALSWPRGEFEGLLFLWALEIEFPHPEDCKHLCTDQLARAPAGAQECDSGPLVGGDGAVEGSAPSGGASEAQMLHRRNQQRTAPSALDGSDDEGEGEGEGDDVTTDRLLPLDLDGTAFRTVHAEIAEPSYFDKFRTQQAEK